MTAVADTIAANLRALREAARLSRMQLARRADTSQQAIVYRETGAREIAAYRLLALADALGVSVLALLGGESSDADLYRRGWRDGFLESRRRMHDATEPEPGDGDAAELREAP